MANVRIAIPDFQLANPLYAAATVTVYTVDANGAKTATKATLYAGPSGSTTLSNPVTLDSEGKFATIPYIEVDVICSVAGISVSDHDTGVIQPPLDESDLDAALIHASQASGAAAYANAQAREARRQVESINAFDEHQAALVARSYN